MTPEQFTYWLQGYAELTDEVPTAEQWQSIREHLATVFTKVTPSLGGGFFQYPGGQVLGTDDRGLVRTIC